LPNSDSDNDEKKKIVGEKLGKQKRSNNASQENQQK
jgi:hypothetical protein